MAHGKRLATAADYFEAVQRIDHDRALAEVDRIPWNVNRAGRLYRRKVREISKKYNVTI